MIRSYTSYEYDFEKEEQTKVERDTSFIINEVKNGNTIEIRHSLLDNEIHSEELAMALKNDIGCVALTHDLSKKKLSDLFTTGQIYKLTKPKNIRDKLISDYLKQTANSELSAIDKIKNLVPMFAIFTFAISIINFFEIKDNEVIWNLGLKNYSFPIYSIIFIIIGLLLMAVWVVEQFKRIKKRRNYLVRCLDDAIINQTILLEEFGDFQLNPKYCFLNNYDVNILLNGYMAVPFIKKVILGYLCYCIKNNEGSTTKNFANIVFSLYEVGTPSFFYREKNEDNDTENTEDIIVLELKPLLYSEKIKFLKERDLENYDRIGDQLKKILKHLNIDCIKAFKKKQDLEKIKNNIKLINKFETDLHVAVKKLKVGNVKGRKTVVSLLYFIAVMTNINKRRFSHEELVRLILDNTDGLLEKVQIGFSLPHDFNQAVKIINIITDCFDEICGNSVDGYLFGNNIQSLLYLCSHTIIDESLTHIVELAILKSEPHKLRYEDSIRFAAQICDYLLQFDPYELEGFDAYQHLLEATEQCNNIDFHYLIFYIVNSHMEKSDIFRERVAENENLKRSSFMTIVHSNMSEALEEHIRFISLCASTKKTNIRTAILPSPKFMDTFLLEKDKSNRYYNDLKTTNNDEVVKFIECLYTIYCISLKKSKIIDDGFFFINKELIDTDRDATISELKELCKNRRGNSFKNSAFDKFINNVELLFKGDNIIDEISSEDRKLYAFLTKLYYYANNSILDEDFVKFTVLILDSDDIGIVTKCELASAFVFYHSYQTRKLSSFLAKNEIVLREIMQKRINDDTFTIRKAYKAIPNINRVIGVFSEDNVKNDLKKSFINMICAKREFQDKAFEFMADTKILMDQVIEEETDIDRIIVRVSKYDPDLVASIIIDYQYRNEEKAIVLIRRYFEILRKAQLTCAKAAMIFYLNSESIEPNVNDSDIIFYLISEAENIKIKSDIQEFIKALRKWRIICEHDYHETIVKLIKLEYKYKKLKIQTDAIEKESDEDSVEHDIINLKTEQQKAIDKFLDGERVRALYSMESLRGISLSKRGISLSKYSEFENGLSNGILLNLFDYTQNSEDIYNLVDFLFNETSKFVDTPNLLFENSEFLFMLANGLYIYEEAPTEEQNMFMMADLFTAAVTNDDESTLDKLFKLLRDKKPDSTAVKKYDDFKVCAFGFENAVINSCMKRIYPLSSTFSSGFYDMLKNVASADDVPAFVDSFISNTNRHVENNDNFETERLLILSFWEYYYFEIAPEDRQLEQAYELLSHFDDISEDILVKNTNRPYINSMQKYKLHDASQRKKAVVQFYNRLKFWEYPNN